MPLLCRVAENLYWLSRYVERGIATIRVVDVTAHLELDGGDAETAESDFWTPLLGTDGEVTPCPGDDHPLRRRADEVRHFLAFDTDNPGSLASSVISARAAARQVRNSISSEIWEQINTTYLLLTEPEHARDLEDNFNGFYKRIRDGLLLIQGLADATVAHDEAWHFLVLGMYLERADNVARLLRVQSHLLTGSAPDSGDETVRWLAVLRSAGSAEAYARFYSLRVEPVRVLEFLLLNASFPQSVRFSLGAAWAALDSIAMAADESAGPAVRALGLLRARLEHASVDEVLERGLEEYLADIHADIATVSDRITRGFFRYAPQTGRHLAVARAAQIMAAQQ